MPSEYAARLRDFLPAGQELDQRTSGIAVDRFLRALTRITTWIDFLYSLRKEDDTSVLLASAHSKVIELRILTPLALIHSSYMALRTVVDICTSYTFYYAHPIEWQAICQNRASWESRAPIVEWHLRYTPTFRQVNSDFGLVESLRQDYHLLSSYVHGVPVGGLPQLTGVKSIPLSDTDLESFTDVAEKVDKNVNLMFISVFHADMSSMSRKDLKTVTRGISLSKLASTGILLPKV